MLTVRGKSAALLLIAGLVACMLTLQAPRVQAGPIDNLNLTEEQTGALSSVIMERDQKQNKVMVELQAKLNELGIALQREDVTTKRKERKADRKINRLVKDVVALYGQLLRNKVEYLLKAKDVLTEAQKITLISDISLDVEFEEFLPDAMNEDFIELMLPLDLSNDQVRKLLKIETRMYIRELKIEKRVANRILDLQEEIARSDRDPKKVNKIILKLTDLGNKFTKNRVDALLKSKDALTMPQREMWLEQMALSALDCG
jgi:Spy/CpxP family protein refolding chaperone